MLCNQPSVKPNTIYAADILLLRNGRLEFN